MFGLQDDAEAQKAIEASNAVSSKTAELSPTAAAAATKQPSAPQVKANWGGLGRSKTTSKYSGFGGQREE